VDYYKRQYWTSGKNLKNILIKWKKFWKGVEIKPRAWHVLWRGGKPRTLPHNVSLWDLNNFVKSGNNFGPNNWKKTSGKNIENYFWSSEIIFEMGRDLTNADETRSGEEGKKTQQTPEPPTQRLPVRSKLLRFWKLRSRNFWFKRTSGLNCWRHFWKDWSGRSKEEICPQLCGLHWQADLIHSQ